MKFYVLLTMHLDIIV